MIHTISTCLWFDSQALEAAQLYTSLFDNSSIDTVSYYPADAPGPAGGVMSLTFHLDGQEFQAINGGPMFPFTEAISLFVKAPTQERIDYLWGALIADGGAPSQCGWLKDRYGLSWQIVPPQLLEMIADPDPARAARVTQEMLTQSKLDIAALTRAYNG